MKVVDHAGNSIVKGRLLRWQHNQQSGPVDFYVKVLDVVAPSADMPGKVEIALTFGVPPQNKKGADVVQFRDFITVQDPEEELRTEAALARATTEPGVIEMSKGAS